MRKLATIALVLAAASGASALGPAGANASNHREATKILKDPTADNTDLYASLSPDPSGSVSLLETGLLSLGCAGLVGVGIAVRLTPRRRSGRSPERG
jgi:hypothetical protein